jgi:hypothetical protein
MQSPEIRTLTTHITFSLLASGYKAFLFRVSISERYR